MPKQLCFGVSMENTRLFLELVSRLHEAHFALNERRTLHLRKLIQIGCCPESFGLLINSWALSELNNPNQVSASIHQE